MDTSIGQICLEFTLLAVLWVHWRLYFWLSAAGKSTGLVLSLFFLLLNVWLIQFVSEALWSEQTFRSHSGVQVVHWFFSEIKPCYSENGLIVTYSLRNSLLGKSKEINHLKYLLSQQVCRNQWAIWAYPTASSVTQTSACSVVDTDLC